MADIDLGFPEERKSAWLTNRYFPSKVGGKPAWLELEDLPEKDKLMCDKCKSVKAFLCQIYAPFDDEHNFHRTIYVFVCRSEACQEANSSRNLTVLRSQLPRENRFYSKEPPAEDGEPQLAVPTRKTLCLVCANVGPFTCGRCKKVHYCSTQHQQLHWSHHKKVCSTGQLQEPVSLPGIVFPEWEIVIESNDQDPDENNEENSESLEQKRLKQYEQLVADGKTGALENVPISELDKYAEGCEAIDDKFFRKFKNETDKSPSQIVRYKRGGQPLWISDIERTVSAQLVVPNCEHCGGPRQFEFQIMPQMLLLLKDDRLDWGVLAVYTCSNSCKPPDGTGYVDEYIVKQDLVGAELAEQ